MVQKNLKAFKLFRSGDTELTYLGILDELMTSYKDEGLNARNWKRSYIAENTSVREYLSHPDNKIKNEQDALDSWIERDVKKVIDMQDRNTGKLTLLAQTLTVL